MYFLAEPEVVYQGWAVLSSTKVLMISGSKELVLLLIYSLLNLRKYHISKIYSRRWFSSNPRFIVCCCGLLQLRVLKGSTLLQELNSMYSWLSRCCTVRGSNIGFSPGLVPPRLSLGSLFYSLKVPCIVNKDYLVNFYCRTLYSYIVLLQCCMQ